jgi:hypothetical protein
MSPNPATNESYCELKIFPDKQLRFNVRVAMGGKTFLAGGFRSPDQAQRRGVEIMMAMRGL